jgi:hypothetical protein
LFFAVAGSGPGAGTDHLDAGDTKPAAGGKSPNDPDATYCRRPQPQTDSRLMGPRVCMTNRQWDALHAQGLDIGADGKSTVASEKYRTLHGGPCHTQQDSCF